LKPWLPHLLVALPAMVDLLEIPGHSEPSHMEKHGLSGIFLDFVGFSTATKIMAKYGKAWKNHWSQDD